MKKKLSEFLKSFMKPLLIISLVFGLVFSQADGALAARSGGRVGGGSFRRSAPPSYSAPSRAPSGGYYPGGGGYYPGGGFGFPFLLPFFGVGGGFGGLFTILVFVAIANFLVRSFRSSQMGGTTTDGYGYNSISPNVSVSKLQVGLLSEARSLQSDLDRIAKTADTSTSAGLTLLLQETTLSLLRHPEYWQYAGSDTKQASLDSAEDLFNRFSLAERSKFTEETLSNVNNQLRQATAKDALPSADGAIVQTDLDRDPGAFIVVTILVATQGKLQLPVVRSSQDLRQALAQLGSVSSDNLMAVEILWTPQATGDTLSSDDMLLGYADLKLI